MDTGTVIGGRGEARLIVCTPGPGMLKSIVLGPGVALESSIAWRRVVVPFSPNGSAALVTVNEASKRRGSTSSRKGTRSLRRTRVRRGRNSPKQAHDVTLYDDGDATMLNIAQ